MLNEGLVYTTAASWLFEAVSSPGGDVVLASPYLSFDVCRELAASVARKGGCWRVFTCLDPTAVANGYLSVEGLRTLMESGVTVSHVNRLHAKIFLIGGRGFLGSANLTGAGLGSSAAPNLEMGVDLSPSQVEAVRHNISVWRHTDVTSADLQKLSIRARRLNQSPPHGSGELDAESALAQVEQLLLDARDGTRKLWLKGEYGKPALEQWRGDWLFGSPRMGNGRGEGRPSIKPRDLVIICAETRDCYAVVEVTSDPEKLPADYCELRGDEALRWPWVSRTKPRFVPDRVLKLKARELVASTGGLQNGHMKLEFDEFTAGVRALARLLS
ncbi:hypothetical protein [Arthrobacter sp. EpRS71]|uniref:hypothetical protein n=1 Tax=Arthrobacter sp. EpRS71 TaxID=1743141 RepID=UPI000749F095|nr:hypothetical protein [Arthrobacter sp. EpRS71]KUM35212.1 hypothetical protein AR689_14210 [Arthrobacter sp. EpRS71]